MFTGIIEQTGSIKSLLRKKNDYALEISTKHPLSSLKKGDSVSISGVCLTLVDAGTDTLVFDVMKETFEFTAFPYLKINDIVNVERALEWSSRIEGHFVLGHVDGARKIKTLQSGRNPYIEISIAPGDITYIVQKGSIAIDGISLTIADVHKQSFKVNLIPYTLENTNLKYKGSGNFVNIEFDILGKYIYNKITDRKHKFTPSLTKEFLKEKGFI